MYLAGRIVSLIIYIFALFTICYLLSRLGSQKMNRRIMFIYVWMLAGMGFFFIPHAGADLTRLITTMHYYSDRDFGSLLGLLTKTTTPGTGIYFFLVGKLKDDRFLPFFSALITFTFCFRMLNSESKKAGMKGYIIATSLFMFMSRGLLMQIISNIRTIMSLSICAWCVYEEFYQNKKIRKLIIPYLIGASMHLMGQVMLLYRIVFLVIERANTPTQKMERGIVALIFGVIAWVFGRRYIIDIFVKADSYFLYAQTGGYSYIWERVLSILAILIAVYLIHVGKKALKYSGDERSTCAISLNRLINYMIPLVIFDVITMFIEFNFFQRTSWFISLLCIPLCSSVLLKKNELGNDQIVKQNLILISFIMLGFACARGDLCSLKFFMI